MKDFNIISFIQNNISMIEPSVQVVAGIVISTMFLRKKKSIETGTIEFEIIKAEKLQKCFFPSLWKYHKMGFATISK